MANSKNHRPPGKVKFSDDDYIFLKVGAKDSPQSSDYLESSTNVMAAIVHSGSSGREYNTKKLDALKKFLKQGRICFLRW